MREATSHQATPLRVAAIILLACAAAPGKAQPCAPVDGAVDQSFLPPATVGNSTGGFAGLLIYGQTFTVGADGVLTSMSLVLKSFGPANTFSDLLLDVRLAPGGVPSLDPGDVLATATVTPEMVQPGFTNVLVTVDLTGQDALVAIGDSLAIVATPVDLGSRYDLPGAFGYPGGSAFTWREGEAQTEHTFDLLFETSVGPCVTIVPIPTMPTWALLALTGLVGLTAVGILRRQG